MRSLIFFFLLATSTFVHSAELLLFAGSSHDIFIGCLNCNKHDSSSVCNKYADFGSKYSDKSIWNKYADYGSKYSDKSPWNKYASNPPVIVDRDGGFYGYLTANKYQSKRTEMEILVQLTNNSDWVIDDIDRARDLFCKD